MRRQLRAMPAGWGYIYLRPDGEYPPNRGERSRPGDRRQRVPVFIAGTLDRKFLAKWHPHNLFH